MATYNLTFVSGAIGAAAPICSFRSTTRRLKIKEIRIINASTTATKVGLAVPAAGTITPTLASSFAPQPRDPEDVAATSLVDTVWSATPVGPSSPVLYQRNEDIGGTVGVGVSWPFPDPVVVPIGAQVTLFNTAGGTSGALDVTVVLDE